ncbi:hypothetical protein ACLMJK_009578, partial [Lecanora helva]
MKEQVIEPTPLTLAHQINFWDIEEEFGHEDDVYRARAMALYARKHGFVNSDIAAYLST